MDTKWKRCSTCKNDITYGQKIFLCSVSTCRSKRTGLTFCSEPCWDAHVPVARHRDAWYEESHAPKDAASAEAVSAPARATSSAPKEPTEIVSSGQAKQEVLVVGSRLKAFIMEQTSMKTSPKSFGPISALVRQRCDEAIKTAAADGRKTLLDRDFRMPSPNPPGDEVLIIASRLKSYVKEASGLRTSDGVLVPLSAWVRAYALAASENAGSDGRKTVLDRDVLMT